MTNQLDNITFEKQIIDKMRSDSQQIKNLRLKAKYPGKLMVLVFAHSSLPSRHHKFLIEPNTMVAEFIFLMRKRVEVESDAAYFLLVSNKVMIPTMKTIGEIHQEYKDHESDILYLNWIGESTFG